MVPMSTARVVKLFRLPSSLRTWKMDHRIDHANIRGLVSSNFFSMTQRTKCYFAKHVTGSYDYRPESLGLAGVR